MTKTVTRFAAIAFVASAALAGTAFAGENNNVAAHASQQLELKLENIAVAKADQIAATSAEETSEFRLAMPVREQEVRPVYAGLMQNDDGVNMFFRYAVISLDY